MSKKIKIGIPRAFLYYRYYILWKTFFENLNCHIILSKETTSYIVSLGESYSVDESCLASKIYLGHVASLVDKCDYILIPRIDNYGKGKKVCVKFNGTYDVVKNLFDINILDYNIDVTKFKYEFFGFLKMGLKLTKNIFKIIYSYILAKKKDKQNNYINHTKELKKINSNKIKILLVSHPYILYDKYLSNDIIKYLYDNEIELIYADKLLHKISLEYANDLSKELYFLYQKELLGAVNYYKEIYDGIIFISSFPCGIDSLVNELAIRKINKPNLNLIIDNNNSMIGIETRLESFIDMLKERKSNE